MQFIVNRRYWSDDRYEMFVVNRFDMTNLLRVEVGFGLPANYKIRRDFQGREFITSKGRTFRAF